ncbi:MAG: lysophospholipid acyltransferase family protein [Weeksellaceae bacterium]|nr:lysophospholipid acyltransferase family protein [Weeksellaceae bacterium]
MLRRALILLWRGWFIFLAVTGVLFFGILILFFIFSKKQYPQAYIFLRAWAFYVFYGSGLWIKHLNERRLPSDLQCVIVSNHTSMMDIMLMYILVKKPMVFVGKAELTKLPVFGIVFKKLNIVVDRKDPNSRIKVFRQAAEKIKSGYSICIFPEGGVPEREVELAPFLDGPFAIATMNNLPLAVYSICGMKERLPYAYFEGGPGEVQVALHPIIQPGSYTRKELEKYKTDVYETILEGLRNCE